MREPASPGGAHPARTATEDFFRVPANRALFERLAAGAISRRFRPANLNRKLRRHVADRRLCGGRPPEGMTCSWRGNGILRIAALLPTSAPSIGDLRLAVPLSDGEREG